MVVEANSVNQHAGVRLRDQRIHDRDRIRVVVYHVPAVRACRFDIWYGYWHYLLLGCLLTMLLSYGKIKHITGKDMEMYGLNAWQINSLTPMSMEQLRLEHRRNTRHKRCLQLWYIDASGKDHLFIESEIVNLSLDERFPWHMTRDWGVKRINAYRRASAALVQSLPK